MMLSSVISSCSRLGLLGFGCQIYGYVIKWGFDKIPHLKNSILELYSQCGRMDEMESIFEESETIDVFPWNMLLMGFANAELFDKSIGIWHEMIKFNIKLNEFSYSALLHACSYAENLMIGEHIHSVILKMGLTFDTTLMNSLLSMYSNCRQMAKAHLAFEDISSPDSISWNAMISGYIKNELPKECIEVYIRMGRNGVETNELTYASIFTSCSLLTELKLGLQLHVHTIKRAFELDLSVSNSLISMYAKCGNIEDSSQIFCRIQNPDLITWNSMINAYARHGLGKEAIAVFEEMSYCKEPPNGATFVGILSSCSRAGLVSEACYHFNIMQEVYGIVPSEDHCVCIVDTLCRAGKLLEAKTFIENMSIKKGSLVWKILLSFCRVNGDAKLGEVAAKKIIDLEPWDSAPYILLSDLHASQGNKAEKAHMRRLMENRGLKKEAGCSWIFS
ncbi:hypothetical protein HPP92_011423 [Vanilla planifolia]|uniref:Pentatricopeptide repeat-containing protein n=1 Tax=Vanilla planifolia TaxID=51239 RepID=A0A835V1S9_VANPL|nr:hypothetical protein HPP92_011423 [Vanilla planifolia]